MASLGAARRALAFDGGRPSRANPAVHFFRARNRVVPHPPQEARKTRREARTLLAPEADIDQRRVEAKVAREKMEEFLSDSWRKSHGGSGVPPQLSTEQRAHMFAALAGIKVCVGVGIGCVSVLKSDVRGACGRGGQTATGPFHSSGERLERSGLEILRQEIVVRSATSEPPSPLPHAASAGTGSGERCEGAAVMISTCRAYASQPDVLWRLLERMAKYAAAGYLEVFPAGLDAVCSNVECPDHLC